MRYSTLFGHTLRAVTAEAEVASHALLLRAGYIRQHAAGIYSYLPLGLRALRRIERVVRDEMDRTGAQEILMPMVHDAAVWRRTGRFQAIDATLVRFADRHGRDLVLAMTHEEIVAELAASELRSYRQLDVVVYQIQTKFRDEARARGGLLRTREFVMKDAYSLHLDDAGLERTYAEQAAAYRRIFRRVGLGDVVMVDSATGDMGGKRAHEFIACLAVGEDTIVRCTRCDFAANVEVLAANGDDARCRRCGAALVQHRGVEVGNIFQLGTRYSEALGVAVTNADGRRQSVVMGCYGIGVSRLVACVAERYRDERGLAWTAATAPFDAHVVVLGRDADRLAERAADIEARTTDSGLAVLRDDREGLAAGERLADADLVGATVRVTLGRDTATRGTVEITERRTGRTHVVALDDAVNATRRILEGIRRVEQARGDA